MDCNTHESALHNDYDWSDFNLQEWCGMVDAWKYIGKVALLSRKNDCSSSRKKKPIWFSIFKLKASSYSNNGLPIHNSMFYLHLLAIHAFLVNFYWSSWSQRKSLEGRTGYCGVLCGMYRNYTWIIVGICNFRRKILLVISNKAITGHIIELAKKRIYFLTLCSSGCLWTLT